MAKSATDLMQELLFSAFLDSLDALKAASNGLPNQLVREINSIHRNTTFGDLPKQVQDALLANVRSAFTRLMKEGYSVAPTSHARAPGAGDAPRPPRSPQSRPPQNRPPRPPRSGDPKDRPGRPGGQRNRPPGKPKTPRG